jgi:hypothetical protein
MGRARRELRRVEHDGVEAGAGVELRAQVRVDIGIDEARAVGVEAIELHMGCGPRQRRRRRVHARHLRGAAGQGRDAEPARVAIAVEHALRCELLHP